MSLCIPVYSSTCLPYSHNDLNYNDPTISILYASILGIFGGCIATRIFDCATRVAPKRYVLNDCPYCDKLCVAIYMKDHLAECAKHLAEYKQVGEEEGSEAEEEGSEAEEAEEEEEEAEEAEEEEEEEEAEGEEED